MSDKNEWGSNISFVLAMVGSAVGLGNIWRYSYVLYSNGGGAFYIPYIVAILLMGVPFLILEYVSIHYNDLLFMHTWMGRNLCNIKLL